MRVYSLSLKILIIRNDNQRCASVEFYVKQFMYKHRNSVIRLIHMLFHYDVQFTELVFVNSLMVVLTSLVYLTVLNDTNVSTTKTVRIRTAGRKPRANDNQSTTQTVTISTKMLLYI